MLHHGFMETTPCRAATAASVPVVTQTRTPVGAPTPTTTSTAAMLLTSSCHSFMKALMLVASRSISLM